MKWDPSQYNRFSDERNQPFFDLTSRINAQSPETVVDLGCGPGDLTATLAQRWPSASVVGIDSSPEMIERATSQADRPTNLRFELADVAQWQPGPIRTGPRQSERADKSDPETQPILKSNIDVVVSNALLQWIPTHRQLLREWADALEPGSWLAFQVPGNFDAPSHQLMSKIAGSSRWQQQLDGVLRHHQPVAEPAEYLDLLLTHGFRAQAWETTYLHLLQGPDPVLQWVRGTGLRPVLNALPSEDAAEFESEYAAALRKAYPATDHGTFFPFRRIFCVGQKQGLVQLLMRSGMTF